MPVTTSYPSTTCEGTAKNSICGPSRLETVEQQSQTGFGALKLVQFGNHDNRFQRRHGSVIRHTWSLGQIVSCTWSDWCQGRKRGNGFLPRRRMLVEGLNASTEAEDKKRILPLFPSFLPAHSCTQAKLAKKSSKTSNFPGPSARIRESTSLTASPRYSSPMEVIMYAANDVAKSSNGFI